MLNILFSLILFFSCVGHFEEKEVYGYYTPVDYKNNFDTIQLQPQGIYQRKVYDKNKKLLLEMKGEWKLVNQNSQIQMRPFYLNLDDDLVKFPDNVKDTSMAVIESLEISNGKIQFCVGYYSADLPNQNCYQKIK